MADGIQLVTSFPMKRKRSDLNFPHCVLFEGNKLESLSNGIHQRISRINESPQIRASCKDLSYSSAFRIA